MAQEPQGHSLTVAAYSGKLLPTFCLAIKVPASPDSRIGGLCLTVSDEIGDWIFTTIPFSEERILIARFRMSLRLAAYSKRRFNSALQNPSNPLNPP